MSQHTAPRPNKPYVMQKILALATVCGLFVLSIVSLPFALETAASAADKPVADLVVNFQDVPNNGTSGNPFTYQVKVENLGPHTAENSRVDFNFGSTTDVLITTCDAHNGAVCTDGEQSSHQIIPVLPAGGYVTFTVTGRFPSDSSTTHAVSATLPDSMEDVDLNSNSVEQQIALYLPQLEVTKTQDRESVTAGQARVYTITYRNRGTADAEVNLHDVYSASTSATKTVTWTTTCGPNTSGVACPEKIANGQGSQKIAGRQHWGNNNLTPIYFFSDTVVMPANSTIEVLVTVTENFDCLFNVPYATASNTADITHTATNLMLHSDNIQGRITGPQCPEPELRVTKVQDKEEVSAGEARTYTVTYENTGTTPLTVNLDDHYYTGTTANKTVRWSAHCGPGTRNVQCPASITGKEKTEKVRGRSNWGNSNLASIPLWWGTDVEIPAGGVLEIVTPVIEDFECLLNIDHTVVKNVANAHFPATNLSKTAEVRGRIVGDPCPPPALEVKKTADKDIVYSGETRNYTVTYTNTGTVDLTVDISDSYSSSRAATKDITWSATCGTNTSGMECPSSLDGAQHTQHIEGMPRYGNSNLTSNEVFSQSNVLIPAGAMLEILVPVTETIRCTPTTDNSWVRNNAAFMHKPTSYEVISPTVEGEVRHKCGSVDVSSSIFAKVGGKLVDGEDPVEIHSDETITLVSRLENSRGSATNVPWTIQLPALLDAVENVQFTCKASEGVICPQFAYDPATKRVTATVASIPTAGSIEVEFNTTVNKTDAQRASAKVQVTAPVEGDLLPEEGTLNPSSLTLGYVPTVQEIPVPEQPGINDPCGADNATWEKPDDSDQLRWELTEEGQLIVHTKSSFVFPGERTSHDFGRPEETHTQDCPVPPLPPVDPVVPPVDPPVLPPVVPPVTPPITPVNPPVLPPIAPPVTPPVAPPLLPLLPPVAPPEQPSLPPAPPVIPPAQVAESSVPTPPKSPDAQQSTIRAVLARTGAVGGLLSPAIALFVFGCGIVAASKRRFTYNR